MTELKGKSAFWHDFLTTNSAKECTCCFLVVIVDCLSLIYVDILNRFIISIMW